MNEMSEEYKPLFMWHMHLRVMANPLRTRNRLTAGDRLRANERLRTYLLTRKLLREYDAKQKNASVTL